MKSLPELIDYYQWMEGYCASQRDRLNDAGPDDYDYLTEDDLARMANEHEEHRQICRDTVAWLRTAQNRQCRKDQMPNAFASYRVQWPQDEFWVMRWP